MRLNVKFSIIPLWMEGNTLNSECQLTRHVPLPPPSISTPPALSYSLTVKKRLQRRNQVQLQNQSACQDFGWDSWLRKTQFYPVSISTAKGSFCTDEEAENFLFWSSRSDGRLSSLSILHIHMRKDVDIDGVVTEFTRLRGRRLAFGLSKFFTIFPFFVVV